MMKYKKVIDEMTLEEKASLMSGKDFWQTRDISRLDIPSIFLADGPHGLRKQAVASDHLGLNESLPATCFPTAATIANSWNEGLAEEIGRALGEEAVSQRVHVLLGPGINIKRNPLCGRNFEYFSEDPFLSGKMGAAYIRGIQSQGVSACLKHFCANNQEKNRMTIDTIIDERTLREIYLTAFEIALQEGKPGMVMSSYNKLNGVYTNENPHIMTDILRSEWGFDGCVVTDWGGGNDRVEGLKCGNELEMPTTGGETNRAILAAVKLGALEESVLNEAVDRLLNLVLKTSSAVTPDKDHSWDIHHNLAWKAAEESIVLLKNDEGILPLDLGASVAIIGDFAEKPRFQGAGSSIVNPNRLDTFLDLASKSSFNITGFARGYKRYGGRSRKLIKEACRLADQSDVLLLFLGLDEFSEVEGMDRDNMSLPSNQQELLDALYEVNCNVVAVISSGSAIEMPWVHKTRALLHTYLSGQAGAGALLNVVSGVVNPSGKLAETYPLNYSDLPSSPFFPGREVSVEYREGLYVGYRYFDSVNKEVLFPYGFGLSYTEFDYAGLTIQKDCVRFFLKNSGRRAGAEIVQLYVSLQSEHIFRPEKELKGFRKVFLQPEETTEITIPFDDKTFRFYNTASERWEVENGEYTLSIGASSRDIRLSATHFIQDRGRSSMPYEKTELSSYFSGEIRSISRKEFESLLGREVPDPFWDRSKEMGINDTIAQCRYSKGLFSRLLYHLIVFIHSVLRRAGRRDLANLIMMSVYHMPFRGISRLTGGLLSMSAIDGLLLMANGHFFRGLGKLIKERKNRRRKN